MDTGDKKTEQSRGLLKRSKENWMNAKNKNSNFKSFIFKISGEPNKLLLFQ
jgi:hypothetical protein